MNLKKIGQNIEKFIYIWTMNASMAVSLEIEYSYDWQENVPNNSICFYLLPYFF